MNAAAKKGFTLIELVVVVAIVGILTSLILANINSARARGRDNTRLTDLQQVQFALEQYYQKYGCYPSTNAKYDSCTNTSYCAGPAWTWSSMPITEFLADPPSDPINSVMSVSGVQQAYIYGYMAGYKKTSSQTYDNTHVATYCPGSSSNPSCPNSKNCQEYILGADMENATGNIFGFWRDTSKKMNYLLGSSDTR